MFTKKSGLKSLGRLKKRSDFLRVQKNGNKWVSKGMIVEAADNENLDIRYGITVSKKVSKSAVKRNKIKRRLRAVADETLIGLNESNIDIVLIGRQETEIRDFTDLKTDLRWSLEKLGYTIKEEKENA